MSPIVKQKKEKFTFPGKYLLFILSIICILLMALTYGTDLLDKPFNSTVGYVVVPFEKGISRFSNWLKNGSEQFASMNELIQKNNELQDKIDELMAENIRLSQDKYELSQLRELLNLSDEYSEYEKKGARIIFKDAGNWYSTFIIDKGSKDGIEVDMNVIASGGLVGRVSGVGTNWAKVTSIINDNTYVSAQILASGDTLVTEGSLELLEKGYISFSSLRVQADSVGVGDKVVTSQISDKFLPGILIGYISEINADTNNLTRSGLITPVVDFEHLSNVLVITSKKVIGE